jgi:glycosyltransferase involved in cell wall biosynthesis
MKILIAHQTVIPVFAYGGTERVVWDLAKALIALGHQVTFLVPQGSRCDFAPVRFIDPAVPLMQQIRPHEFDVVHFQHNTFEEPDYPYVVTEHGNSKNEKPFPRNTVFVSKNHAQRYGSDVYALNGLDWSAYPAVDFHRPRTYYHFLGKGSWPVKNLRGAIQVARAARVPFEVLGGKRLNLSRTIRFTPWPSIHFHGMVGGQQKFDLLNGSRGLIFPVRWHEPFGLAVIESLYFGCPVFATPYGALPELVDPTCGVLSERGEDLVHAIHAQRFDPRSCHVRATHMFDHLQMGRKYLELFERVVAGETLNPTPPRLLGNGHQLIPWRL